MIEQLKRFARNLERFDLEEVQYVIVDDNKDHIADLQAQQLAEGKDITGKIRNDSYAPMTVRYKQELGKGLGRVTDRVTFFFTGELYNSLEARINKAAKTYTTGSTLTTFVEAFGNLANFETKFDKMVTRIGYEKYGLDRERQLEFFNNITKPGVRKILLIRTELKM